MIMVDPLVPSEHQSMFDPLTCTRRGMCPITHTPHQREPVERHSLYFEVHGTGPQRIVLIRGLNNSSFGWLPQVKHFSKLDKYSTLVFDNRGVGMSGAPWGPYSSSGMAEDVISLLNYLQWTEDRSLHVVGTSLGGMIAQELAHLVPSRIVSLSLLVTRAGGNFWTNFPSLTSCLGFARLFITINPDQNITILEGMMFPKHWLDSLAEDDSEERTNREVQREVIRRRMEFTRPQTLTGAIGQITAVLTHNITPNKLAHISASVPKVLILSAAEDILVPYTEGENLKRHMPQAEYQCWEKTGHGICDQCPERVNQLLERIFEQGKGAA